MSVITNKWNDGSGDSINIESPSFQGNQTVKISSPVQKGTSKRSMKFIGKCKKDSSKQVILIVEQEASTYTYDLTLNSDNTEIAAKGGTANITAVLKTYRNGNLVSTDNVTPVLSGSATGFSISGVTVTASNRTTVVGAERSITVTGKYSDTYDGQEVSATVVVKQEANTLDSLWIRSWDDKAPITSISAAGVVNTWYEAWGSYTSGVSSVIEGTYSGWSSSESFIELLGGVSSSSKNAVCVTVPSRGTVVGGQRKGNLSFSYGGRAASISITQAANAVVSSVSTVDIWLGSGPGGSESNPLPASGGRIQYTAKGNTRVTYTSGSYINNGFTPKISGYGDGFTVDQPSAFAWWITADSRGTVVGGMRSVTVTASDDRATPKSVTVYQQANFANYGALTGGSISASDIPASGGTSTTSISNMSQTISYTSGSTRAGTVTYSKTSEITVSSLGTTVKARTKVGQVTVTYTGEGSVTANKTVDIYQAANAIDSYNYGSWNIAISANPTTIAASGGTSTITASCMRTKTPVYTSGSAGTATTESATPTLAISGAGFTLSGTTVTASKNNVASRTATVTASYSGATSKSVTITQSAGPDGIGYMQIEGNDVDHYIFQVGRTPNTRSNDVQTLSEEPAEVATEIKSESLFAKIKRIVTNLN